MKSGAVLLILFHSLADNLDVANNGVLNLRVLLEGFEVRYGLKVVCRPLNRFRNVF